MTTPKSSTTIQLLSRDVASAVPLSLVHRDSASRVYRRDQAGPFVVELQPCRQPQPRTQIYRALTKQVDHYLMKNRDDMNAVIEGLPKKHGLLAAFLEASGKIDWRALQRQAEIGEMPEPLNMEAHRPLSITPKPDGAPFAFRRANLVRASE